MNNAWIGLEKAPQGSMKNKIHGYFPKFFFYLFFFVGGVCNWGCCCCRLGLKLLSGVKPSEMFLKSISKEVSQVEVTYPSRSFLCFNFFSVKMRFINEMKVFNLRGSVVALVVSML